MSGLVRPSWPPYAAGARSGCERRGRRLRLTGLRAGDAWPKLRHAALRRRALQCASALHDRRLGGNAALADRAGDVFWWTRPRAATSEQ